MRLARLHIFMFSSLLLFLMGLTLLTQPFTVRFLAGFIEQEGVTNDELGLHKAQAIVVLGGGAWKGRPSASFAERLTRGAELAEITGLPLLISGGLGTDNSPSEAEIGRLFIAQVAGLPTRWLEDESKDTWENAVYSAQMLKADGINTVFLVTSRSHLRRSLWSFSQQGICAIPVGAGTRVTYEGQAWSHGSFWQAQRLLHEVVGMMYYWFKHGSISLSTPKSHCVDAG